MEKEVFCKIHARDMFLWRILHILYRYRDAQLRMYEQWIEQFPERKKCNDRTVYIENKIYFYIYTCVNISNVYFLFFSFDTFNILKRNWKFLWEERSLREQNKSLQRKYIKRKKKKRNYLKREVMNRVKRYNYIL